MKRNVAFYQLHYPYVNAGLIACHANAKDKYFRQKDLKFYIELLSNWMETSFKGPSIEVLNPQVQRILDQLVKDGHLKKTLKKNRPAYCFTAHGLLEISTRLIDLDKSQKLEEFFFIYHFIILYSTKLENLIVKEKGPLPKSYVLEIKHLLNPKSLVDQQKEKIKHEIYKLEDRIEEAHAMSDMAKSLKAKNMSIEDIISNLEKKYPYQLNNQKKMTDVFKGLSPDVKWLESMEAPKIRAITLWGPLLKHYKSYLSQISLL